MSYMNPKRFLGYINKHDDMAYIEERDNKFIYHNVDSENISIKNSKNIPADDVFIMDHYNSDGKHNYYIFKIMDDEEYPLQYSHIYSNSIDKKEMEGKLKLNEKGTFRINNVSSDMFHHIFKFIVLNKKEDPEHEYLINNSDVASFSDADSEIQRMHKFKKVCDDGLYIHGNNSQYKDHLVLHNRNTIVDLGDEYKDAVILSNRDEDQKIVAVTNDNRLKYIDTKSGKIRNEKYIEIPDNLLDKDEKIEEILFINDHVYVPPLIKTNKNNLIAVGRDDPVTFKFSDKVAYDDFIYIDGNFAEYEFDIKDKQEYMDFADKHLFTSNKINNRFKYNLYIAGNDLNKIKIKC